MIRLESLCVERDGRRVVQEASITIGGGEAVAVIGRTAAGKSSLLETLAAVMLGGSLPSWASGRLMIGDREMPRLRTSPHQPVRLGYLPPLATTTPALHADEFLEMIARSIGLVGKPLRQAVTRGLAFAACQDERGRRFDLLSDGTRKRLMLAAALINDPDVLILDDPMASLDPPGREVVKQVVADLVLAGGSVIAALNDASPGDCWTRVLLLEEGRLLDTADQTIRLDDWPAWSLSPLAAWRRSRSR